MMLILIMMKVFIFIYINLNFILNIIIYLCLEEFDDYDDRIDDGIVVISRSLSKTSDRSVSNTYQEKLLNKY